MLPFLVVALAAVARQPATGAGKGATAEEALAEARRLMEERDCKGAARAFRKAEKAMSEPPFELLAGAAQALNCLQAFKDAEEYARRALAVAGEPLQQVEAYNRLGQSLFAAGSAPRERLEEAARAFRQALDLSQGQLKIARYNLGYALLKLERDEEGVALLEEFLASWPEAPMAAEVRALIANPMRARVPMIPEFELVTLDGRYVTSEDLRGKVVLIDFWATWCGPCRAALPHLRRLAKRIDGEPFLIVSVSGDRDEGKLRETIAKERMTWPQAWDEDGALGDLFAVKGLPTYVLVDHRGVILYRTSGWSPSVETQINGEVKEATRALKGAAGS